MITQRSLWLFFYIVCGFAVREVKADDTWVNLGGRSYHVDRSVDHREFNYGIGIRQRVSEHVDQAIGYYKNSNDEDSAYLSWPITWRCYFTSVRCGVAPALVLGYKTPIVPVMPPMLNWQFAETMALNIIYIPKIKLGSFETKEEVWWFRLEFLLKD